MIRAGYGIFYDSLNAMYLTPNQTGFSRTTSTNFSNNYGQTWLVGNPANGISPLSDPFPVRADGTRFDVPVRTALGSMAYAGQSFSYTNPNIQRTRNQRFRIGVARELNSKTIVEAAWADSLGDHVYVSQNGDPLPAQYWAPGNTNVRDTTITSNLTANVPNPFQISNFAALQASNPVVYQQMSTLGFFTSATTTKQQLLRPFPQMSGLTISNNSVGKLSAPSFEATFRRAVSRGVSLNVNYTAMKARTADFFLNQYDKAPSWENSQYGEPNRLNISGLFELPFGEGRQYLQHGTLSRIVGGWQLGLTYEYQTGLPIQFSTNLFYYGNYADIAKGPHLLSEWFNTANFETNASKAPATYQARTFPMTIDGVRAQPMNEWNVNVLKEFGFKERLHFELRLDALNLMNHTIFSPPNTNPTATNFGQVTATTEMPNRYLQLQGRIRF